MTRPRAFLALCLCLAFSTTVLAQEVKPNAQKAEVEPDAQKAEVEQQAFELIKAITAGIPGLRSAENRIFLTAAVVDLLWVNDEKQARGLFERLTTEVGAEMSNLKAADQKSHTRFGVLQQQRREIIERMAARDPELAVSFMRATRPPSEMTARVNDYSSEMNLEFHLAGLIAQKDPQGALKLARANLQKGVNYSGVSVLFNLSSKSPEVAQTLHGEIVDKLRTTDLTTDHEAANAAWNLLGSFPPPQSTEDTYRGLVELLATSLLSAKADFRRSNAIAQNATNQISAYMTQFEKYTPARVVALRQWSQQIKRSQDPGSRVYAELQESMQKGTIEDILGMVNKYGQEHHPQIYQQAVQRALASGDPARARQIINEFIPEGAQRTQMLDQLDNQLFWMAANENKIAEALQLIERVQGTEKRFQLLTGLAQNVINRGDLKQATTLLMEASSLVESMPRNSQKLNAQLQLAQCYTTVDSRESVALLQPLIALVNQLVEAAAVLDGFENSYLSEGEWMKRGHTSLGHVVNIIGQNIGTLARVDMSGARSLSDQIERPEIRLMAQLEIAQNLLRHGNARQLNIKGLNQVLRHPPRH